MRRLMVALGLVLAPGWEAVRGAEPESIAQPRLSTHCILESVLARLHLAVREDLEVPRVFFESTTPLSQFQDATAPQWGFTPDVFANAYVPTRNEIYLMDGADVYRARHGSIDDSLAHELTHYVQTKYLGMALDDDPSLEFQAVDVQTWFRDTHLRGTPADACARQAVTGSPRIDACPDPRLRRALEGAARLPLASWAVPREHLRHARATFPKPRRVGGRARRASRARPSACCAGTSLGTR